MRVRGDNAPSNAFTLEEQPKKPGFFLVRFYENAQEFSDDVQAVWDRMAAAYNEGVNEA